MTKPAKHRLLLSALALALLASSGCAVDPTVAAAIAAALADDPTAPRPSGAPVGLPIPTIPGASTTLPTTSGGMHDPAPGTDAEQVLDVVNQARALAGIAPVVLDPAMSAACAKHAHYMVLNAKTPAITDGLNAHHEQEGLPGYTEEGAKAGAAADLSWGQAPVPAVLGLLGTLYHRTPILSSSVVKIGYAFEKDSVGGDASVLMFEYGSTGPRQVAAFPADGQTDVPLAFDGGERPNPVPEDAGITGYPVTLALPGGKQATHVSGKLMDASGAEVPTYYSDQDHPASYFEQGNVVCMFAKKPLKQGTTYRASVSADLDGTPTTWSWKFTTLTPQEVAADDVAAVKRFFGKLALVRGTVKAGGLTSGGSGSRYLKLNDAVNAFIPSDIWAETKLGDAAKLKGKTVTVRARPRDGVTSGSVALTITAPDDLTVVD